MTSILVTGSTGCIGSNLVAALLQNGDAVRALHREGSNLLPIAHLNVERRVGDIRDMKALLSAMEGCDTVFHTAALVSFWRRRREEQLDINVGGTRNVVEACLRSGVRKLVHTSSVAAIGQGSDGELLGEDTPFLQGERVTYKYSKHLAEREVLAGVSKGLAAIIVNPTVVIGPGDLHMHGGQLVRDVAQGRVPAYLRGGMNVVGVHDVVRGHIAAAGMGRTGERYILGGSNLTHREVFALVASALGKRPPSIQAPVWAVRALARGCDLFGAMTGREPWITSELISGAGLRNWYSIEKAKHELGYTTSPLEPVVRETYEWYRQHGII